MPHTLTSAQLRAARGLLNWTVRALAEKTGVHRNTISAIEGEKSDPNSATLQALRRALEVAGVEFIARNGGGPGVRLKDGGTASDTISGEELNASNDE